MSDLGPAETHLVSALQHLRAADSDLRMCLTLLRQENREVPGRAQEADRPLHALGVPAAVGEDQHQARALVGGREVAVQEGLEVAEGRR